MSYNFYTLFLSYTKDLFIFFLKYNFLNDFFIIAFLNASATYVHGLQEVLTFLGTLMQI